MENNINYLSSSIDEGRKPIKIFLKKNGRKTLTCIEGLSKDYLKDYKKRYSCNGFYDDKINLQGDHREEISKLFFKENIFHRIF